MLILKNGDMKLSADVVKRSVKESLFCIGGHE